MNTKKLITNLFLRSVPNQIASKILDNNPELDELVDFPRISYGDLGAFSFREVIVALELLSLHGSIEIKNAAGICYTLEKSDVGIVILLTNSSRRLLSELGLLDLDSGFRLMAFKSLTDSKYIRSKVTEKWLVLLNKQCPNEKEFFQLLDEIRAAPWEQMKQLRKKTNLGLSDLFPENSRYYQALLPAPIDNDNEAWVKEVLIPDLMQQLDENLKLALWDIFSVGFDGVLNLLHFVEGIDNEKLLGALTELADSHSPFVCLGALDIAFHKKNEDDRYSPITAKLLDKLNGDDATGLMRQKLDLLALYIEKSEQLISALEETWKYPLSWRKLSAFMHANHLVEAIGVLEENYQEYINFLKQPLGNNFAFQLFDRVRTPFLANNQYTADKLNMLMQGRMLKFRKTIDDVIEDVQKMESNKEFEFSFQLVRRFSPLINCPNRLQEILGSQFFNSNNISDVIPPLLDQLRDGCVNDTLKTITAFGTIFLFELEWLSSLVKFVDTMEYGENDVSQIQFFEVLDLLSGLAAVQPSEDLANAIAIKLYNESLKFNNLDHVQIGCGLLVLLSGAIVDTEKRRKWLENQMAQYAFCLSKGNPSKQLITTLRMLECALPLNERCFGRAKKYAAVAIK